MTERGFKIPNLSSLTEAARLSADGRLREATELIQRSLSGQGRKPGSPQAEASSDKAEPAHAMGILRGGLGQVLRGLQGAPLVKGLKGFSFDRPSVGRPESEDVRFVERSFRNQAGERAYKLFLPTGHKGKLPLVIMLHGCTQSPDDFAAGTRMNEWAQRDGIIVAYPRQTQGANAQKCWNWFETRDQGRERGEAGIIAGLTRSLVQEHPIDPTRIYIAGLSAGGAFAANVAQAYPDLFAGLGVHSGLAAGCARDLSSALMAMRAGAPGGEQPGGRSGFGATASATAARVPTIVFHGATDTTVSPRNGDEVLLQAGSAGLSACQEAGAVPGGHRYTRTRYLDEAGAIQAESWRVEGAGHAWSGGSNEGSYTDPLGPDASRAMLDFFALHRLGNASS